jgi:hypothetical protein
MASDEAEFDPYLKWFGIHPKDQPPNHYRLLGIELFESDPDVISNAGDSRMLLVKTFQTGGNADVSQRILNEVAAAKVRLLTPAKKADYDAALRRQLGVAEPGAPVAVEPVAGKRPSWALLAGVLAVLALAAVVWIASRGRDRTAHVSHPEPGDRQPAFPSSTDSAASAEGAAVLESSTERQTPVAANPAESAPAVPPVTAVHVEGAAPQPGAIAVAPMFPDEAQKGGERPSGSESAPADDSSSTANRDPAPQPAGPQASPPSQDALPTPPEPAATMPGGSGPQDSAENAAAAVIEEELPKLPVPTPIEEQRAEKDLREAFRTEIVRARTPRQRLALADEMFRQGIRKEDDPVTQYVLFQMACDLASGVGEVSRTMRAAEEIARRFEIDALELKVELLESAVTVTRNAPPSSVANLDIVENGLLLADAALSRGDVDLADEILKSAGTAARRTKSGELLQEVNVRTKARDAVQDEKKNVDKALETLSRNPDDAEANLTVGIWYCFVREEWQEGLPRLARCGDPSLAAAASLDLTEPDDPQEQLAVGEAWWQAAESHQGFLKARMARRAAVYFKRAVFGLPLDASVSAQERLDESMQAAALLLPDRRGTVTSGNVALATQGAVVTGAASGAYIVDGIQPPTVGDPGVAGDAWPCEWTITLDQVYRLREIRLKLPDDSYENYALSTSPDGEYFVPLADRRTGRPSGWQRVLFLSRPVKAIRIHATFHSRGPTFYVTELEAYCAPPNTAPQ